MSNFHCQRELSNWGYSFCIFTRSFRILQNEDPNDFVSFGVWQGVFFIVKIQGVFSTKGRPPWFCVSWHLTKRLSSEIMTPSGSTYPYRQCIGVPPPPPSLGSDKAFWQGSSFYRFRGLFLQNEDPIDFTSIGVWQSVLVRVVVL